MSEVRCKKSEVRGQMSDVRYYKIDGISVFVHNPKYKLKISPFGGRVIQF